MDASSGSPSKRSASQSLLRRVALGAAASAMFAAVVAASVTSLIAVYLTRSAADRRVQDAALVLAAELDDDTVGHKALAQAVTDEVRETRHTGMAFAVYDRHTRQLLAGDPRVPASFDDECTHTANLRTCGVPAREDLWVVAAAGRTNLTMMFVLSSTLAALLAGVGAWLASRPVARWLMGPLSELRQQVGAINFSGAYASSLGPPAGVAEVDALRSAINELLERAQVALRQAERFAADAAHELRTPLTAIRGELELLAEESALPGDVHASLTRAQHRVVELGTLLERLLALALPIDSKWVASELISLQELAEDLLSDLPDAERARVQLAEAQGEVVVRGDSALLGLLFTNGLGNALKFGQHVWVCAFQDADEVVWRVDDDGPGVPGGQRELVFEPFVRLATNCKPAVPGHGLGLALIAHVARRHGGLARFVDGPRGAHLEIRLPRHCA
ncbi:MAG TPA: HAMP domain-containing sensor histidine kinase [Polyangiaceae bacterium]|nr:HAMP domain-containing sensor histidine kinase [Polyangiaceae bacterium]